MSNLMLYLSIGAILGLGWWIDHWRHKRAREHMMVSEWTRRLNALDTVKPMRSRIEGKVGVSSAVRPPKIKPLTRGKVTEIKRKTGTK